MRKLRRISVIGGVLALVATLAVVGLACSSGAQATTSKTLMVEADTVTGGGCLLSSQYKSGDSIVFRIKVYDPTTGEAMDNTTVKTVAINFGGKSYDAKYGAHPGSGTPTDHFWTYGWTVPANYPTGALNYTVTATANDGRTGTYKEFNVSSSLVTIVK